MALAHLAGYSRPDFVATVLGALVAMVPLAGFAEEGRGPVNEVAVQQPADNRQSEPAGEAREAPTPEDSSADGTQPEEPVTDSAVSPAVHTESDPAGEQGPAEDGSPSAPASDAEVTHEPVKVDAATFKGVQPGHSTRDELNQAWGEPKDVRNVDGMSLQTYKVESFERVRATVSGDVVSSIVVYFDKPFPPQALSTQLGLGDIDAVEVFDDKGNLMGQAYPERGVLFGFAPDSKTPAVAQILLEPIDPQPFVARAESRLDVAYARSLADLDYALSLDDQNPRAHHLRARVLTLMGRASQAYQAAQQAAALEPAEPEFRLTVAQLMKANGDVVEAHKSVQHMIDNERMTPIAKTKAILLLADCLTSGPQHNYAQAIQLHTQAIKLAEPLATNEHVAIRRSAKELLLEAHLAVAHDIGWGSWQQKETAVPKWLERAKVVAEEMIANEHSNEELMLRVYQQALEALAGVRQPLDPTTWVESVLRVGKKLIDESQDPARKAALEWRLGTALMRAVELESNRGRIDSALAYGDLATNYLSAGAAAAEQVPGRDYLVGRHFYTLGNIHAVKREDHKAAMAWYQKATELLERPVPFGVANGARQGEAFVSMAVSFWETGDRKEALRLTSQGALLIERAVDDGIASRTALAVPYGNLASMHQELGNSDEAKRYAQLATSCEATARK